MKKIIVLIVIVILLTLTATTVRYVNEDFNNEPNIIDVDFAAKPYNNIEISGEEEILGDDFIEPPLEILSEEILADEIPTQIDEVALEVKEEAKEEIQTKKTTPSSNTVKATNTTKKTTTTTTTKKQAAKYNMPYYIKINRTQNVVNIYQKGSGDEYDKIYKAMICSIGTSTPKAGSKYKVTSYRREWNGLKGGVYGQYATQIVGNILFHSVPYTAKDKSTLEYWEYDKLGTKASLGCIRLTVKDAKWIYDNIAAGTIVEFYEDDYAGPLGKPTAKTISDNELCRNWDPTDPAEGNPWNSPIESENVAATEEIIENNVTEEFVSQLTTLDDTITESGAIITIDNPTNESGDLIESIETLPEQIFQSGETTSRNAEIVELLTLEPESGDENIVITEATELPVEIITEPPIEQAIEPEPIMAETTEEKVELFEL